jgi:hypothetical protein
MVNWFERVKVYSGGQMTELFYRKNFGEQKTKWPLGLCRVYVRVYEKLT